MSNPRSNLIDILRDEIVVNERWATDMQRISNRHMQVSMLFFDALEKLPVEEQKPLLLRFRAIDNEYRSMYHGNKVTQSHNEQAAGQAPSTTINPDSPNGQQGGPMGEEE